MCKPPNLIETIQTRVNPAKMPTKTSRRFLFYHHIDYFFPLLISVGGDGINNLYKENDENHVIPYPAVITVVVVDANASTGDAMSVRIRRSRSGVLLTVDCAAREKYTPKLTLESQLGNYSFTQ